MSTLAYQRSLPPTEHADVSVLGIAEGGLVVYIVAGQIVASTASAARSALRRAAADPKVVLDLSEVSFVDEVGLGVLAGTVRRVHEAGGGVVICAPSGPAASALRASGVGRLVPVVADLAAARLAFSAPVGQPRSIPLSGGLREPR